MYKSCSRCGKIHSKDYQCNHNKPKYDNSKYKSQEDKLRNTSAWQKKSAEVKEASQYLCAVCRAKGIYTYDGLEVHHIVKLRHAPDKLLDNNNLICLCKLHHMQADKGTISKEYLENLAKQRKT